MSNVFLFFLILGKIQNEYLPPFSGVVASGILYYQWLLMMSTPMNLNGQPLDNKQSDSE